MCKSKEREKLFLSHFKIGQRVFFCFFLSLLPTLLIFLLLYSVWFRWYILCLIIGHLPHFILFFLPYTHKHINSSSVFSFSIPWCVLILRWSRLHIKMWKNFSRWLCCRTTQRARKTRNKIWNEMLIYWSVCFTLKKKNTAQHDVWRWRRRWEMEMGMGMTIEFTVNWMNHHHVETNIIDVIVLWKVAINEECDQYKGSFCFSIRIHRWFRWCLRSNGKEQQKKTEEKRANARPCPFPWKYSMVTILI